MSSDDGGTRRLQPVVIVRVASLTRYQVQLYNHDKTAQIVNLADPDVTDVDVTDRGDANALDVTDLVVDAYDREGRSLGIQRVPILTLLKRRP